MSPREEENRNGFCSLGIMERGSECVLFTFFSFVNTIDVRNGNVQFASITFVCLVGIILSNK